MNEYHKTRAQAAAPAKQSSGGGLLFWLGLAAAAVAYATMNTFDPRVDQFRNSKGQFRGGKRWG